MIRAGRRGLLVLPLAATAPPVPVPPDFTVAFWRPFRTAILRGDVAAAASLTVFPLLVFGEGGGNATRHVPAADFATTFSTALATPVAALPDRPTMRQLAGRLDPDDRGYRSAFLSDGTHRVWLGAFAFARRREGWRLVGVNLDESATGPLRPP